MPNLEKKEAESMQKYIYKMSEAMKFHCSLKEIKFIPFKPQK